MPQIVKEPCQYCRLMHITCKGKRPCVNCVENEVACVDHEGPDYPSKHDPSSISDFGWTAYYKLQAKIAIRQTNNKNPASHLPGIRVAWAKLRDEVKELYRRLERKDPLFTCGKDIDPVKVTALHLRYLKYTGKVASDETGDEEARRLWLEEPYDMKRFWGDVVMGITIDREGSTKLLGVVPPARPMVKGPRVVEVEYKGAMYELDEDDYRFFLSLRNMSQGERIRACLSAQSVEGSSTLSKRVQRLTQVKMNGQTYQLTQADHIFFLGACRNLSKEERVSSCFSGNSSSK